MSLKENLFMITECVVDAVAVDGGHDYLRMTGYRQDWEELSVCEVVGK